MSLKRIELKGLRGFATVQHMASTRCPSTVPLMEFERRRGGVPGVLLLFLHLASFLIGTPLESIYILRMEYDKDKVDDLVLAILS